MNIVSRLGLRTFGARFLALGAAVTVGLISSNALALPMCGNLVQANKVVQDGNYCKGLTTNCMEGAFGTGHAWLFHYRAVVDVYANGQIVKECGEAVVPGECCTITGSRPACPVTNCVGAIQVEPVEPVLLP